MPRFIIDARSLADQPLTGVGKFVYSLLQSLRAEYHGELYAYIGKRQKAEDLPPGYTILRSQTPSKLTMVSWTFGIPLGACQINDDDIFLLTSQNFPPRLAPNARLYLILHDLSWLHYPDFFSPKARLWHKGLRLRQLLSLAQTTICVSEATRAEVHRYFPEIDKSKFEVVYPGLETINASNFSDKRNKILFLGTHGNRKNIESVILAWKMIEVDFPQYELVIAGKKGWKSKETIVSRVTYLPYVTDATRAQLYSEAVLFLWPSFYEGFGFPLLEAQQLGVPVITSFTTSLPEIMKDSARYINPWNAGELAAVMRQSLVDPQVNRQVQTSFYSWSQSARNLLAIIFPQ